MKQDLESLIDRFVPLGTLKRGELLLEPTDALELVDRLVELRHQITGASAWFMYPEPGIAAEIGDRSVDVQTLNSSNPIENAAKVIKTYIESGLPPRTNRVSLAIQDSSLWKYLYLLEGNQA